jgi:hypothetical protein
MELGYWADGATEQIEGNVLHVSLVTNHTSIKSFINARQSQISRASSILDRHFHLSMSLSTLYDYQASQTMEGQN